MKKIIWSSKKFGQLEILVDDEDYERVKKYPWGVLKCVSSDVLYVKSRNVDPLKPRKYFSLHRFILGIDDPKIFVDHRDGDGLNNQRSNLRIASNRENCQNKGKNKNNTTGFKGVSIKKDGNLITYQASLGINTSKIRKTIYGGRFKTPEEAAIKYNELARIHHGEFAYQNPV